MSFVLRPIPLLFAAAAALAATGPAEAAGYSVSTAANTGRGYARGCQAGYNVLGLGASFISNDGGSGNCLAGGGPGSTSFNEQSVTVSGTTDKTGALTSAHDESTVAAFNGYGGQGSASAAADLATGQVHLYASGKVSGGDTGVGANAKAVLSDTLHFTVAGANASTVTLIPVGFTVAGTFNGSSPAFYSGGSLYYGFQFGDARAYEFGDYGAGTVNYPAGGSPTYAFPDSGPLTAGWQSFSVSSYDPSDTRVSGVYAITGASADIPISFYLEIRAGGNVTLDYSNGSGVSIGQVDGVSFTSDSGVFLSAVPEPDTWALMLAGFAVLGGLARRRGLGA